MFRVLNLIKAVVMYTKKENLSWVDLVIKLTAVHLDLCVDCVLKMIKGMDTIICK